MFSAKTKGKTMQQIPCKYFKNKLTKDYMAQLKADTDLQVSDTEVPGYHLRYSTKTGRKVLYLHYILRLDGARRERNLRLGSFPELSAPAARAEAIKYRGQIITGIDPMLERQESLRKAIGEQEKKIPLKIIMERYLEEHSKPLKKLRTSRKEFQLARKYVIPMLGNIPITELGIRHLEKFHTTIGETSQSQANHCIMLISYFLNWCEKQEYRTLNTNPVRRIRKFKLKGRDRVLSDAEYERFFIALDAGRRLNILNPVGFDILAFVALTGCRSGEVKKLTWDEVDFDNSILRLKDSKTGAKSVPVGEWALDILKAALRDKKDGSSPVFPNSRGRPFADLDSHWKFITDHAKLENLNIHDLRHSFATTGSMTGENVATIGQVLGHSTITTTARYMHNNNIKGVECANHISDKIARKGKLNISSAGRKLKKLSATKTDDAINSEPKKRGRPRKIKEDNPAPKKRGRPCKKIS